METLSGTRGAGRPRDPVGPWKKDSGSWCPIGRHPLGPELSPQSSPPGLQANPHQREDPVPVWPPHVQAL